MKLQGTFLTSRAGRRIFWTLLLAAAVPIAALGVALHALLSDHFESQSRRQQVQMAKFAGMGLLDRLLVARTALGIAARTGRLDADPVVVNRRGNVLLDIVHVDANRPVLDGNAAPARRWQAGALSWPPNAPADAATLSVGRDADERGARPVWMVLRRSGHPGELWVGAIDPSFLFGELAPDANGARLCVLAGAEPVFCPSAAATGLRAELARADAPANWNLFLRSDFGIDDWTLVALDPPTDSFAGALPLARLSALGAAATLLFVGMLGLIQVRRTMVPLERLIAGTRRLSERDFTARVQPTDDDEFGELARSFNHMADRIGSQVQAMQVQSSIDREILNGLNVARVLQRVAQRLEQLAPGTSACVVEFDQASPTLARVHTAHAPLALLGFTRADAAQLARLPDGGLVWHEAPPAWLARALPQCGARLAVQGARASGELLGLLLLGTDAQLGPGADIEREIGELCDRVSVTLASADRERRLLERATHDNLTGLANRAGLYEFIEAQLVGGRGEPFTVMFIDLDRFKEVNDAMGHQFGDELLRTVARRLQGCVPPGTLVARPGGDEFVLVLPGPRTSAEALVPRLRAELMQPVPLAGRMVGAGGSMGMAQHPEHGQSASDLMRRADMAMYSAKARGGGEAAWFEPALDDRIAERTSLLADLGLALARRQFGLCYQPRIDAHSGALAGAEALLRWHHPNRGQVPVATFIELLEQTGLIHAVGLWAIDQAMGQLAQWRAQGLAIDSVAVNLSTRQLASADLPDQVAAVLSRHGLAPANLELEVTESIFMGDSAAAIRVLQRLHDSGIRIALDDFGTGYSSLSYLHKLPIAVLKVDRSFVCELGERDSALALTRSIIALARSLGLRVVAEGVEHERQATLLRELGCDELQGFLFARPLSPVALAAFASDRRAQDAGALTPA